DVLLRVHRSYLRSLLPLVEQAEIRGLAHITGGGVLENIPRILPPGLAVRLETESWEVPELFRVLQRAGGIQEREMFRAFNMGIGMVAVVEPSRARTVLASLEASGERAWAAGTVVRGEREVVLSQGIGE
ncbi:MAG: phosphoribosylformylglycinamidine cyclo-ligase, partial [Gemmatimonadetes bacterium]|nr:phosphoribosylformylglycinamidine cyclo-ligase [Gemmatimonadota bacterium]